MSPIKICKLMLQTHLFGNLNKFQDNSVQLNNTYSGECQSVCEQKIHRPAMSELVSTSDRQKDTKSQYNTHKIVHIRQ